MWVTGQGLSGNFEWLSLAPTPFLCWWCPEIAFVAAVLAPHPHNLRSHSHTTYLKSKHTYILKVVIILVVVFVLHACFLFWRHSYVIEFRVFLFNFFELILSRTCDLPLVWLSLKPTWRILGPLHCFRSLIDNSNHWWFMGLWGRRLDRLVGQCLFIDSILFTNRCHGYSFAKESPWGLLCPKFLLHICFSLGFGHAQKASYEVPSLGKQLWLASLWEAKWIRTHWFSRGVKVSSRKVGQGISLLHLVLPNWNELWLLQVILRRLLRQKWLSVLSLLRFLSLADILLKSRPLSCLDSPHIETFLTHWPIIKQSALILINSSSFNRSF